MKHTHEIEIGMLANACIYSLRYSLFRKTAAPWEVAELIEHAWPVLHENTKRIILKEAREHLADKDHDTINMSAYWKILELEGK